MERWEYRKIRRREDEKTKRWEKRQRKMAGG
jgi:hypothetical protein